MKIISIKPSRRNPERIYLNIFNGPFLPLYIDDLVSQKFTVGQELTEDDLKKIVDLSLNYLSWEYSLRQIGLSPKTEKILKNKLNLFLRKTLIRYKINFSIDLIEIINNCLDRLKEKNLLDEQKFIEYFIKKNKHKSQREIKFLLKTKGVDIDVVSDDLGAIKKILFKKVHQKEDLFDINKKNKIMASLYRKGFSLSDINSAIDDFLNSR